ncbi:hypothetical protein EWM64_g9126 [Hericium alpestre]|uniref:DUF6589 domain-containing protein n=1 Tax=Hericium alpestre TaxID=135208 RepID=A0A4Y9ZJX0_9AGAM|nr:hypothetical protein EWM64_g9126 [Hericium alpestre]
MAATAVKMVDFDPKAWDLDDKLEHLAKNEHRLVDVDWFLGLIDQAHMETIKVLQWLQTLVHHVPELNGYRQHVNDLYKTRAAKCLPSECKKTEIYPLAVTQKDENLTTELRDAIVEFLSQLGQKDGDYVRRLILAGGDGLMYEKFLQMKKIPSIPS